MDQQKKSPRLACLVVPLFPLAARLRSEPALRDEAVVLCEGNGTAAQVVAATRKARKAGAATLGDALSLGSHSTLSMFAFGMAWSRKRPAHRQRRRRQGVTKGATWADCVGYML